MPASGFHVEIHGLRELRADLRRIDRQLPRDLNKRIKREAEPVRAEAARLAPRSSRPRPASDPVRLADSLKVGVRGSRVVIYSRRTGATTIHYGGRHPLFGNRSRWFQQQPTLFIAKAAEARAGGIERAIAREVETLMRSAGFH
jgi:hypothetical protein